MNKVSKNKTITIVIVLFIVTALLAIVKYAVTGNGTLASPWVMKVTGMKVTGMKTAGQPAVVPSPVPQTPSYNPPKEIKYSSATDLKSELESINPQVSDSDFEF